MDPDSDKKIQNILADLNDEKKVETFNRKYFSEYDGFTPSNTPCSKNSIGFSLHNIDYNKFYQNKIACEQTDDQIANFDSDDESSLPSKNVITYCNPIYIGKGDNSDNSMKVCNNLLCTKCDIKVSYFPNHKWCTSCDYMFFRNYYGDQIKLREKLLPSIGTVCYSCQCSWTNVTEDFLNVDKIANIQWSCSGHHQ